MIVRSGHVEQILRIAALEKNVGREACGFILGQGLVVEVPNMAQGAGQFLMDPEKQLWYWDDADVIWHTHPEADASPSSADGQMFDLVYGHKSMLIVAVQTGRWTLTS